MSRRSAFGIGILVLLCFLAVVAWALLPFYSRDPLEARVMTFTPEPAKGPSGMMNRLEVRNRTNYPVWIKIHHLEHGHPKRPGKFYHFTTEILDKGRGNPPLHGQYLDAGQSMIVGLSGSENAKPENLVGELSYTWTPATMSDALDWFQGWRVRWLNVVYRYTPQVGNPRPAKCPVSGPGVAW